MFDWYVPMRYVQIPPYTDLGQEEHGRKSRGVKLRRALRILGPRYCLLPRKLEKAAHE